MTTKPKGVYNLIEELEQFYKTEEERHNKLYNYELSCPEVNTIKAQIEKAKSGECFLIQNKLRELRVKIADYCYKSKTANLQF